MRSPGLLIPAVSSAPCRTTRRGVGTLRALRTMPALPNSSSGLRSSARHRAGGPPVLSRPEGGSVWIRRGGIGKPTEVANGTRADPFSCMVGKVRADTSPSTFRFTGILLADRVSRAARSATGIATQSYLTESSHLPREASCSARGPPSSFVSTSGGRFVDRHHSTLKLDADRSSNHLETRVAESSPLPVRSLGLDIALNSRRFVVDFTRDRAHGVARGSMRWPEPFAIRNALVRRASEPPGRSVERGRCD